AAEQGKADPVAVGGHRPQAPEQDDRQRRQGDQGGGVQAAGGRTARRAPVAFAVEEVVEDPLQGPRLQGPQDHLGQQREQGSRDEEPPLAERRPKIPQDAPEARQALQKALQNVPRPLHGTPRPVTTRPGAGATSASRRMRSATASQVCPRRTVARASLLRRSPSPGSSFSSSSAAARAPASPGGQRRPFTPCSISSASCPTGLAPTAAPAAMYS